MRTAEGWSGVDVLLPHTPLPATPCHSTARRSSPLKGIFTCRRPTATQWPCVSPSKMPSAARAITLYSSLLMPPLLLTKPTCGCVGSAQDSGQLSAGICGESRQVQEAAVAGGLHPKPQLEDRPPTSKAAGCSEPAQPACCSCYPPSRGGTACRPQCCRACPLHRRS